MKPRPQIAKRIAEQQSLQRHLRLLATDVQHDPTWLSSDGLESGWSWVLEQPRTREEIEQRLEVVEELVAHFDDESVNARIERKKQRGIEPPATTPKQDARRADRLTFLGKRYALRWVLGLEPLKDEPYVMDDRGTWGPPHDSDYYRIRFLAELAKEAETLTIAEGVRRKKKRRDEQQTEKAERLQVERQAELNAIGVDRENA